MGSMPLTLNIPRTTRRLYPFPLHLLVRLLVPIPRHVLARYLVAFIFLRAVVHRPSPGAPLHFLCPPHRALLAPVAHQPPQHDGRVYRRRDPGLAHHGTRPRPPTATAEQEDRK